LKWPCKSDHAAPKCLVDPGFGPGKIRPAWERAGRRVILGVTDRKMGALGDGYVRAMTPASGQLFAARRSGGWKR
jgi:hypothetical protein